MKNILIFGGTGQLGVSLCRRLSRDFTLTVLTRNTHQKAYRLKTSANAGYLSIVEGSIFDEKGGGAVGMKQAVRKITDAVNNPSAFKAELQGIITDKQFKDMMNIAGGQQYADDDITRTKMLAEGSRNKFGFGGGDNFYFPN